MPEDLLHQGIEAAQAGDISHAQVLLAQAVRQIPNSAEAWYWFGVVLKEPEKKKYSFDRAAALDPTLAGRIAANEQSEPAAPDQPAAQETPEANPSLPDTRAATQPQPPRKRRVSCLVLAAEVVIAVLVFGILGIGYSIVANRQNQLAIPLPTNQVTTLASGGSVQVYPTAIATEPTALTVERTSASTPTQPAQMNATATQPAQMNATAMYQHLSVQITAARKVLDTDQNDLCIQNYDELLTNMPNWPIGYYNRGICERAAALRSNDQNNYKKYTLAAIKDQDMAISLQRGYANAYVERGLAYFGLEKTLENSADLNALYEIALNNVRKGQSLGSTHPEVGTNIAADLIGLNRCQEGVNTAKGLFAGNTTGKSAVLIYEMLAEGNLCLGDYSAALENSKQAILIGTCCEASMLQTEALIGMKNPDQAFQVIDLNIRNNPDLGGYRYYLRALLHFDRGEFALSRQDLDQGAGKVWFRGGLYAYVNGLLALHDGNRDKAVEWMQYASSSLRTNEGLWLLERLQKDLAGINAPYATATPGIHWDITPMPGQPNPPAP